MDYNSHNLERKPISRISAEVSDNVTEGIVEPIQESIQSEILQRQLISILLLIPMLIIFGFIIKAIRTKNNYMFYIGFCLTAIPCIRNWIDGSFSRIRNAKQKFSSINYLYSTSSRTYKIS